jgi:DNA-binding PadR family transcriptional regulator/YHS domain-containing protein
MSSRDISSEHLYSPSHPHQHGRKQMIPEQEGIDSLILDFSRFYILTILYEGPAHGYQILSSFKKRVKKEVSPSLVYPFLQQLESKGLVKHVLKYVGEKEKKVFELTEKGRGLATELFKRFAELVSIAIEPSLYVCAHCGCKVYEGGHAETVGGVELTFCCMHCAHSFKESKKPWLKEEKGKSPSEKR